MLSEPKKREAHAASANTDHFSHTAARWRRGRTNMFRFNQPLMKWEASALPGKIYRHGLFLQSQRTTTLDINPE